eukprot:1697500-Amphidinium_carterae.1
MEIETVFKCTRQRIIADKIDYKTERFHDSSIITTGVYYNADYAVTMFKYYHSEEQKNKSPAPPSRQRCIVL